MKLREQEIEQTYLRTWDCRGKVGDDHDDYIGKKTRGKKKLRHWENDDDDDNNNIQPILNLKPQQTSRQ